jgi:Ca-activated chloride channel family protein
MSRFYRTLTATLSITLITACSQSDQSDVASPSAETIPSLQKVDVAEEDASAIVVTGQKRGEARLDTPTAITVISSDRVQSAPPSASRQMVVTGSAIRAPYPDARAPYYQDVGRDKFTATARKPLQDRAR